MRPAICICALVAAVIGSCATHPPISSGLRFVAAIAAVMFMSEMIRVFERLLRLRSRRRW
jgi:hypothetical protein